MARKILGWGDDEFWSSTPRKFSAVYFTYINLQDRINNSVVTPKPLSGKDAIKAMQALSRGVR